MVTPERSLSGRVVLIIEDHPSYALLLERAWLAAGFGSSVLHVMGGRKALAYLQGRSDKLALVFLSLIMPDFDSFELVNRLKSNPRLSGIPVVLLAASPSENDGVRARELGVEWLLVKPS